MVGRMGLKMVGLWLMILVMSPWVTAPEETCSGIVAMMERNDKISITDFGGVGDGMTVNTKAFEEAIYRIRHLNRRGGTLLYIPPGVFLTDSFNLTSHMTLYLASGAVSEPPRNSYVGNISIFSDMEKKLKEVSILITSLYFLYGGGSDHGGGFGAGGGIGGGGGHGGHGGGVGIGHWDWHRSWIRFRQGKEEGNKEKKNEKRKKK